MNWEASAAREASVELGRVGFIQGWVYRRNLTKLLEFPVPMVEEVARSARENALLAVVLGDRRVTFVDGHERKGRHGDDIVVEVIAALEHHGG